MKKTLTKLAFPSILAVAMLLTSCATSDAKKSTESAAPIYETAKEIQAMPPCKATVVHTYPCYSLLRATDGKKFCIGSPGATPEVGNFVETLKDGQTYKFPAAFLTYQKQQPR
jgi:hypothetical protein